MNAYSHTSPPLGNEHYARLKRRVLFLGVLVIVVFAAVSAVDTWRSYENRVEMQERDLLNVAKALAEQTSWTWQAIDLLLQDTGGWYVREGHTLPDDQIDAALAARAAGIRQVRALSIIDAQGVRRHRSRLARTPTADVSSRSYYTAQRDHQVNGLFSSEPLITRSEGRRAVELSRRLEDAQGLFEGVIVAVMDLEDLERAYGAVDLGGGSGVHLLRNDGTFLVRNPARPTAMGHKFPQFIAMTGGESHFVSPVDGTVDFAATAPVPGTPLLIAVTRERAIALASQQAEAARLALLTLAVTVLGAFAITALLRQLSRAQASEAALRQSEERYALAMEGANEGHWDWDLRTDQLFLSPQLKTLLGVSDETEGIPGSDWLRKVKVHPDDEPRRARAVRDHLEGHTPSYDMEFRVRHSDEQWHWLRSRGRVLGPTRRFVGSVIEITSEKQAQAANERLQAQLRQSQKLEALGTLAGGIAHDFNNILGAVFGYGELAQQRASVGTDLRRYIDNVLQAAGRARALVERILTASRSGMQTPAPVNVQAVVEETLELLAPGLPPQIRLEAHMFAGDAAVAGEATRLHQVTMNLCTNAVQAMQGLGVLRVRLETVDLRERRDVRYGALNVGRYVVLTVSDTGTGIAPEVAERIFDPFFTTKGPGEGTGLGLWLVHGIVAELGGSIDLATTPGAGTTFSVWIPVVGTVPRPAAGSPDAELPHGTGQKVMIVDDEPALVAVTTEMLTQLGFEPVGFTSSAEALRAFRRNPDAFDIVLTDQTMPEMTGTDLARQLLATRPHLPIALMTGHADSGFVERAGAAGVGVVLRKPLKKHDLAAAFARLIAGQS